ncbi:MOSC domain-containing protein [Catenovulum sp. 2E275]|uniref:MOSC domain-containing protein n=1 Tax=Catenovulum sp. 2E275 TaxID=2980497 RepID=UPI0021D04ADE|nr:MOSC domain-containing protein [Catenovulum sp. 2E275]MCU4677482.1 MOSC domain-containing protein [Catenovulum sp. 2E275]
MQLLSINVGKKKSIAYGERQIETGIFKQPVASPVRVMPDHIEGDEIADLKNHGGFSKAVYAYGYQHYDFWQKELNQPALPYGSFGENLTISLLDENDIHIGDTFQLGQAVLTVTQPRVPCFKLGLKFDLPKMPRLFSNSLKTGLYLSVIESGDISVGNTFELIHKQQNSVSILDLFNAYFHTDKAEAKPVLQQALQVEALSPEWREQIEKYLT